MALSVLDQPYAFTPRGQRLLFRVASTEYTNDGFKYGVKVVDETTFKEYEFFIDRSPATNDLLFDLSSVIKLRNEEINSQISPADVLWEETQAFNYYTIIVSEWWLIGGILTKNEATEIGIEQRVFNAYYQPSPGYKPDVENGSVSVRFSLKNNTSRAFSDRFWDTHTWLNGGQFNELLTTTKTFIPVLGSDAGVIMYSGTDTYLVNNIPTQVKMTFFPSSGIPIFTTQALLGTPMEAFGCYPYNLELQATFPKPSSYPNWSRYYVQFIDGSSNPRSMTYVFYNAELYGQYDCRYQNIRLGWVNSRGGWDYQNFIKKNEVTTEMERKQYKKLLWNDSGTFDASQRQLTDRETIVTKTMTITSDWIQENEFVFLQNLYHSNQVIMLTDDGQTIPINILDNSFTQKKERNGKLFNITIKFKYSQDYWT